MKKSNTRRALLMSVLSLLLCVSMLIGTTYAWFTDTATSGNNQIIAGTLDIELEYSKDMAEGTWKTVEGSSDLFSKTALWEPGYTEVVYLKLTNKGNLALKYNFSTFYTDTVVGKSVLGNDIYLSKYLKYGIVDVTEAFDGRDAARAAVKDDAEELGVYTDSGKMTEKGDSRTIAMVVFMPEEVGNEANYRGEKIPQIDLGVSLLATQLQYESDTFGPEYDAEAGLYQIQVGNRYYTVSQGMYESWKNNNGQVTAQIYTPEDLLAYSMMYKNNDLPISGGTHSTLTLENDLDFTGINWEPIGRFYTDIKGNGKTISNLNNSLLGCVYDCQVKDLTLKNVTATGSAAGVVAKELAGDIFLTNVTIAGTNAVTYMADGATNWPEEGTGVGAICGVSLIGCAEQGAIDVTVTGTVTVNYNGGIFGNNTNLEILGHSKEYGLNIYEPNTCTSENVKIAEGGSIVTNGEYFLLNLVAEGLYKDPFSKKPSFYVNSPAGLANFAEWRNSTVVGEGSPIGAYCTLMADLDMTGVEYVAFNGQFTEFDGNGHTVSNLTCEQGMHGKAGFVSYLGGGIIKDLTLENITAAGCQVGAFVGQSEGGKIINCVLKGKNVISWEQNTTSDYVETWGGIGALIGYNNSAEVNVTIAENTVVTLAKNGMTSNGTYNNDLTGYGNMYTGTVTNNGTVTVD